MRHLPLWPTGSAGDPLALFPAFVISVIALSVLLTWLYEGTEGSPLLVVLLRDERRRASQVFEPVETAGYEVPVT
jgi:hypothetical protein